MLTSGANRSSEFRLRKVEDADLQTLLNACCREGFRENVGKNANEEPIVTGRTYMSRLKLCLTGPCKRVGVNKSVVCKEVPKKNETRLGIVDGTLLQPAEEAMRAALGWIVDKTKVIYPQRNLGDKLLEFEGINRKRGQPPRDDRLGDTETKREREKENAERRERKERERHEKERERASNLRPLIKGDQKIIKVGKVIEAMRTNLREGIERKAKVKVGEKVEDQMWAFEVEARDGGFHAVKISQKPECTCRDYELKGPGGSGTWVHCKHIYAILYKGLGVTWETEKSTVPLVH
jgi:hypothetical protein